MRTLELMIVFGALMAMASPCEGGDSSLACTDSTMNSSP